MKKIIRVIVIDIVALFAADKIATGLVFQNEIEGLFLAGAALGVATLLVKPILNILILPLTLATMGVFKFLTNAVTLYIVDLALHDFQVIGFNFAGLSSKYLDLPAIKLNSGLFSYIAFAFVISLITGLINWLRK